MKKVRILHFSDLHFKSGNPDSEIVRNAFLEDLKNIGKIDLVVFTGDLVKEGVSKEDYSKVKTQFLDILLENLNLKQDDIFFTPGNHDIQQNKINQFMEDGLLNGLKSREEINALIDKVDDSINESVTARLENYINFRTAMNTQNRVDGNKLFSTYKFVKNDLTFGLVELNSAWRATGKPNGYDKGKLIIGERQIDNSYNKISDCEIKIAISHHPFDWLLEFDKIDSQKRIYTCFDFFFTGHVHDSDVEFSENLASDLIHSKAGCLYYNRKNPNSYTILEYDYEKDDVQLEYRSYFDKRRKFDIAVDLVENGIKKFKKKRKISMKNNKPVEITNEMSKNIYKNINKMLFSYSIDSSAPKDFREIFVEPDIFTESESQKKNNNIQMAEKYDVTSIFESTENFLVFGKRESGKTTIINSLVLKNVETSSLEKIKIVGVISCKELPKGINRFEKAIISFLSDNDINITLKDLQVELKKGNLFLLIDDIQIHNDDLLDCFEEFYKMYPNNRYIITADEDILSEIGIYESRIKKINDTFSLKKLHIHSYKTKHVRKLINNWFKDTYDAPSKVDVIVEKVVRNTSKIYASRTPGLVSLMIWIYEKQQDSVLINKSSLMEKVIEVLLEKYNILNSRYSDFDYRDKEHYLAYISQIMVKNDYYYFTRVELEKETLYYFTDIRQLKEPMPVSDFINYFLNKGIFIQFDNRITFKYKSYCEFFIAKRMTLNENFKNYILSIDKYLMFSNEIDYFSGLTRNNHQLVNWIYERLNQAKNDIVFDTNISDFDKINCKVSLLKGKNSIIEIREELQKIELTEEGRDEMLQEMYPSDNKCASDITRTTCSKQEDIYLETLVLFSRVFRNSDLIEDIEDRKNNLRFCISNWAQMTTELMAMFSFENEDNSNSDKFIVEYFKIGIPSVITLIIKEYLGTEKLGIFINNEIFNTNNTSLERLLYLFLYGDLNLENYLENFKRFVNENNISYFNEILNWKLRTFYIFKNLKKSEKTTIEDLIAQLVIRENNIEKRSKKMITSQIIADLKSTYLISDKGNEDIIDI